LNQLGRELDELKNSIVKDLGEKDVEHIRNTIRFVRYTDVAGRLLLHFGIDPVTFVLGSATLGISKIFEGMEVGHNVIHGQYDWTGDPELSSSNYEWDFICAAKHWKMYHNYEHHTFTNIIGKDVDVGYEYFRLSKDQKWEIKHLIQPMIAAAFVMPNFEFQIARHPFGLKDMLTSDYFLKKLFKQLSKDYVIFPLLSFTNAPRVFLGNFLANRIRSLWLFAVIWCGHFPDGVSYYTQEECKDESRGAWYLRQARGSANIEGNKLFYLTTGHLSHQIEHHLFPDVPASRYPEMAPKVKQILQRYDQEYNTGSFLHQFGSVIKNVIRYSLP
jgi:linoleoyl-CoA desaturase